MKNLAVFASGSGTNAENIINYFNHNTAYDHSKSGARNIACIQIVISNKPDAFVLSRASGLGVSSKVLAREELTLHTDKLLDILEKNNIHFIILAGYLLKIPASLIEKYSGRIINIHPALLPHYGGKGMYGHHVHEAVIAAKEKKSGITIHLVDEKYDNGQILFQAECPVTPQDTPDTLAEKIHLLEQANFPRVIEAYITGQKHPYFHASL